MRWLRWAGVAVVVVFYGAVVFFGVLCLAAVQLRCSGGPSLDAWRINYQANRLRKAELTKNLGSAREALKHSEYEMEYTQFCLGLFEPNGRPKKEWLTPEMVEPVARARQLSDGDRVRLDPVVECLAKGKSKASLEVSYYKGRVEEDRAAFTSLDMEMKGNAAEFDELKRGHGEFWAFRDQDAATWPYFWIPYDLLVLLLVMVMGAFGGIVRLLRDFGTPSHPNPTEAEYLLIPLIGAVVAIGGFVLARAGLLVLSTTQGEAPLSPYTVSLVGIVAGLLAKEMIDKIAQWGRGVLKTEPSAQQP